MDSVLGSWVDGRTLGLSVCRLTKPNGKYITSLAKALNAQIVIIFEPEKQACSENDIYGFQLYWLVTTPGCFTAARRRPVSVQRGLVLCGERPELKLGHDANGAQKKAWTEALDSATCLFGRYVGTEFSGQEAQIIRGSGSATSILPFLPELQSERGSCCIWLLQGCGECDSICT